MSSPPARARRAAARTRREAARERIVAAAERLLRDRPYRELSVEEVMAEAGLSRTIFYRHFDGLPELVLSLFDTDVDSRLLPQPTTADELPTTIIGDRTQLLGKPDYFIRVGEHILPAWKG